MRYRRAALFLPVFVAATGGVYLACRAYVRSTSAQTVRQAARLVSSGQTDEARRALEWLLWFDPAHAEASYVRALCDLREQNLPAAIEHLERVGDDSVFSEKARIQLATALLAERQFGRAEAVLRKHLSQHPKSIVARRQLSGLLLTELRRREAVRVLEDYLRMTRSDSLPQEDRLLMLRDLSTAEFHPPLAETCAKTLSQALQSHPDQPSVQLALGQCSWEAGETAEAERLIGETLRQRPQDLWTQLVYGEFLMERGDVDAAERVLPPESDSRATADDRYWALRSGTAERRNDLAGALGHIDRAISLRPHDKTHFARRARLLQRSGRDVEARAGFERSHELARAELDMWDLSRDVGAREPTTTECRRMAQLYDSLGKTLQAEMWRLLGTQIAGDASRREAL